MYARVSATQCQPWHTAWQERVRICCFQSMLQVFEAEQQKLDKNKRDAMAKVRHDSSVDPAWEHMAVLCSGCRAFDDPRRRMFLQQEFQAEQDYMKTLSYLSPEEQRKYKERQSVSWLYQKPPGLDAADKSKVCRNMSKAVCAPRRVLDCTSLEPLLLLG